MKRFRWFCVSHLLLAPIGQTTMADHKSRVLFDFAGTDASQQWRTVDDGVMGGVSEGRFRITDRHTLEFFGTLALENGGGFSSVRSRAGSLRLVPGDILIARVRGDGRTYSLNLYVPRPLLAFSYRAPVRTKKDEWIEVRLPLDRFQATSFGRPVPDAGPVDPKQVNGLGFLLGDKKAGPFRLEVDWIKAANSGE